MVVAKCGSPAWPPRQQPAGSSAKAASPSSAMIFFLIASPLFCSPFPLHDPDQAPSRHYPGFLGFDAFEGGNSVGYLVTAAVCCLQISRSSNQENYSAGCFFAS